MHVRKNLVNICFLGIVINLKKWIICSVYLTVCAKACQMAIDILKEGGSAIDAAAAATTVLEDAGDTNAGFGSNLTEIGK